MALQFKNIPSETLEFTSVLIPSSNNVFKEPVKTALYSLTDLKAKKLFCRICLEDGGAKDDKEEQLVNSCNCAAVIHLSCLEKWLEVSGLDKCEICKHVYKTIRVSPTFFEYLRDRNNQHNIRNLKENYMRLMCVTPLLLVLLYWCILGAIQYFANGQLDAIGLVTLSVFLILVYLIWCVGILQYHCNVWRYWKQSNLKIKVLLQNEKPNSKKFLSVLNTNTDDFNYKTDDNVIIV